MYALCNAQSILCSTAYLHINYTVLLVYCLQCNVQSTLCSRESRINTEIFKLHLHCLNYNFYNSHTHTHTHPHTQPLLSDISFRVEDTLVHAHKLVLCARCDVMAAMLTGGFMESQSNEVICLCPCN